MTEPAILPRTLPRLTSLRAFGAGFVFLFHFSLMTRLRGTSWAAWSGYSGVAFFFILSGFVLTWAWPVGTQQFYWRRFARIYPAHLAALGVVVATSAFPWTPRGMLLGSLLVQAWAPAQALTGNPVAWSLDCEMFFYLLLPFALPALLRLRRDGRWALVLIWFTLTAVIVVLGSLHGTPTGREIANYHPLVRSGEFLLGVCAAIDVKARRLPRVPVPLPLLLVVGATLGCWQGRVPTPLANLVFDPGYLLLIIWAAQADMQHQPGWLRVRPLQYLGELSFCFYLVHATVLVKLAGHHLPAVTGLVIALGLAAALHHLIERPCQRWLLHINTRRAAAAPAEAG